MASASSGRPDAFAAGALSETQGITFSEIPSWHEMPTASRARLEDLTAAPINLGAREWFDRGWRLQVVHRLSLRAFFTNCRDNNTPSHRNILTMGFYDIGHCRISRLTGRRSWHPSGDHLNMAGL